MSSSFQLVFTKITLLSLGGFMGRVHFGQIGGGGGAIWYIVKFYLKFRAGFSVIFLSKRAHILVNIIVHPVPKID